MRKILTTSVTLAIALACSSLQAGQPTASEPEKKESSAVEIKLADRDSPLKIGEVAPNFRLQDQTGTYRTLNQLLEKNKKVALVFYRSANW